MQTATKQPVTNIVTNIHLDFLGDDATQITSAMAIEDDTCGDTITEQLIASDNDMLQVRRVKNITSAGILPFAVYKRRVFFLLGKEGYQPHYNDSDKWSDFGGKIDKGESIIDGACREFYQETAGCVMDMAEAKQRILSGDYLLSSDLHARNSSSFRTYLMLVPYKDYPAMFRRTKHFVQYVGGSVSVIEKTQLNWFSMREARDIVYDNWGEDRYKRKPKFRPKFAEMVRRLLSWPTLQDACVAEYQKQQQQPMHQHQHNYQHHHHDDPPPEEFEHDEQAPMDNADEENCGKE